MTCTECLSDSRRIANQVPTHMAATESVRTIAGIAFGAFSILVGTSSLMAQEAAPASQPPATQARPAEAVAQPNWTAEELEIVESSRKFDEAFGKGDIEALLGLFSSDIRIVDESGGVYEGLEEARRLYADGFEKTPGATLRTVVESIHLVTPDVAVEDGTSVFTPTAGDPVQTTYQAVYARKDGAWKLSQLRDYVVPQVIDSGVHSEYLAVLDWVIGEWVFEGSSGVITGKAAFVDDGNAIDVKFTTSESGVEKSVATLRIGYDPRIKQIKSWTFDSAGGHGTTTWARVEDSDTWLLKNEAVLPNGKTVTTSQLFELAETGDKIYWTTFDKSIDGVISPNRDEVVMTRKAPAPAAAVAVPAQGDAAKPAP